jgi:hypothetical protein
LQEDTASKCYSAVIDEIDEAYKILKRIVIKEIIYEVSPRHELFSRHVIWDDKYIPPIDLEWVDQLGESYNRIFLLNAFLIAPIGLTARKSLCDEKKSTPEEGKKEILRGLAVYFENAASFCRKGLDELKRKSNMSYKEIEEIERYCKIWDKMARELYNKLRVLYPEKSEV